MKHYLDIWLLNAGAFTLSFANVNPVLTFLSLILAISFTIYKWRNLKKQNNESKS